MEVGAIYDLVDVRFKSAAENSGDQFAMGNFECHTGEGERGAAYNGSRHRWSLIVEIRKLTEGGCPP